MKRVTPSVFTEDRYSVPPYYRGANYSYVITSEGIVLIDTPMTPTHAVALCDEIKVKGELRYILNTDYHPDHSAGNAFFPGTVVSHELTRAYFTVTNTTWQKSWDWIQKVVNVLDPQGAHLLASVQPKKPTITFTDKMTLHVGDKTFELIHLPGHTQATIGVYLLPDKVLFTGDNFTAKTQPGFLECLPLELVNSLKKMESLDIDYVVPGHGKVSDKAEIKQFRMFVETCIKMVRDVIKQGMTADEASKKLSFEGLYGDIMVHPEPRWQPKNILRIYEMLFK